MSALLLYGNNKFHSDKSKQLPFSEFLSFDSHVLV